MKKRHPKRKRHHQRLRPVHLDPGQIKIYGKPRKDMDVDLLIKAVVQIAAEQLAQEQHPNAAESGSHHVEGHAALDSDDLIERDAERRGSADHAA
jgi:hypothetical protein